MLIFLNESENLMSKMSTLNNETIINTNNDKFQRYYRINHFARNQYSDIGETIIIGNKYNKWTVLE